MTEQHKKYYEKRGQILVKNLKSRRFDAVYCADKASALEKALEWIPEGVSISWGGALSCQQIGLMDAVKNGSYNVIDRDKAVTPEERDAVMKQALLCNVFLSGANALTMDGEMVNIDGNGNRVAAIVYGPDSVIVVAGMNKVCDSLEDAIRRARTVAAPLNKQRFPAQTPCEFTGTCADCRSEGCICNQILITRGSRVPGRIKFIIVGEDLGF